MKCRCNGFNEFCSYCCGTGERDRGDYKFPEVSEGVVDPNVQRELAEQSRFDEQKKADRLVRLFIEKNAGKANKGNAALQFSIGSKLMKLHHPSTLDEQHAISWYTKAALLGHIGAQNNLGIAYASGRGCRVSMEKAHYWFFVAFLRGSVEAKVNKEKTALKLEKPNRQVIEKNAAKFVSDLYH